MKQSNEQSSESSESSESSGVEGGAERGAERGAQEPIAGDAWLLVVAAFLAILMKFFHETSGC